MRKEHRFIVLASVLMSWLTFAPLGYALYRHWPPRIVTVDLHTLVEEHQQRIRAAIRTDHAVTEAQRATAEQHTADFAQRLSSAIEALGQTCHCVILNKAALLAGTVPDQTDWVRERIQP